MLVLLLALHLAADSVRLHPVTLAPGETIAVTIQGEGPPVVLVNGLLGGAFGYRQIMQGLAAAGYMAVAIEPLGLGHSSRPKGADYSLTAQADRLAAVLDALGVRQALVVGHALGTSMVLRLCLHRPDLVRGILSIDGGPAESAATPGLRRAMRFAPLLKLFVGRGTIVREVRSGILQNTADSSWLTTEVLEGYTAGPGVNVGATIDALRGMAKSVEPEPLAGRLVDIAVPVRLLIGTVRHESAVLPAETALMASQLRDFALDSVPGSGQLIHEEQPAVVLRALQQLDALTAPTRLPVVSDTVNAGAVPSDSVLVPASGG